MQLKLKKISTKSFIFIFSIINVIAGFIIGTVVSIVSIAAPPEEGTPDVGVWAVLIFPVLNGVLGLLAGVFFTGVYNFLAKHWGGLDLEFEDTETPSK